MQDTGTEESVGDIVKSFMKNRPETYGKTRETLPLEGGGKRVGVKGLTGIARRLRKHSTDTEPWWLGASCS